MDFVAVLGSVLTALPVSWTYIACRKRDEYDNSIIRTIIILPMLLTSIVLMVHNSLALAFSLAGIVGAVRFRNTLKSPGDRHHDDHTGQLCLCSFGLPGHRNTSAQKYKRYEKQPKNKF